MKLLLHTMNGLIRHDFVMEVLDAIEYHQWRGVPMEFELCGYDELALKDVDEYKDCVPIGSLEFVERFCKIFIRPDADKYLLPINVPDCLIPHRFPTLNIDVKDGQSLADCPELCPLHADRLFVKSRDRIKSGLNGVYVRGDGGPCAGSVKDLKGPCRLQVSAYEPDDVVSEWRCIVDARGISELKGIQFYLGDFEAFPDPAAIRGYIDAYSKAGSPAAYTLDVYVDRQGRTKVMEVHELYSCGLYGFSSRSLPYMMAKVFGDIRRKMIAANKD